MKTKLLFLSFLIFTSSQINAQTAVTLPYYEGFDYTVTSDPPLIAAGTNLGYGNWYLPLVNGTTPDPWVTASPVWSLPVNLPAATGNALFNAGGGDDPVIPIPLQGSTAKTIYSSFMYRVVDQSGVTINSPTYFYSFSKIASSGTALNHTSCIYINKVDATNYKLAVQENNNTTGITYSGNLAVGTDYFIVISYEIYEDPATAGVFLGMSRMWINPILNGTEPTAPYISDDATSLRDDLSFVRYNLDSNTKTPNAYVDEIRIANTWLGVTTNPTASVKDVLASKLNIYPIPAKDYITIESKNVKLSSVELYNVLGAKILDAKTLNNDRLNISGVSKGIYMLKVNAEGASSTKKIVID